MNRKIEIITTLGLLLAACFAASAVAGDPLQSDKTIFIKECKVEYEQTTVLASPKNSILQNRLTRRGDKVKAGQVLGRLYDLDIRATVEKISGQADNDIKVRLSKVEHARLVSKLKTSQSLGQRNFVSQEDLRTEQLDVEKAKVAIEDAEHDRRLAQIELRKAEAELRALEFVSPHDGIVTDTYKNQGESVAMNEPIFKIVNRDVLRITGQIDVVNAWQAREGQRVQIVPDVAGVDLPVEKERFSGRVVFVDTQIDPDTQTCRVIAEVENREGLLLAGLKVRMDVLIGDPPGIAGRVGWRDGGASEQATQRLDPEARQKAPR